MQTFVHDDPMFIRYSICHIEPVKVIMQDLSQAVVKLSCVTDNACGSVQDTLQGVSDRLRGSSEYGVALVNTYNATYPFTDNVHGYKKLNIKIFIRSNSISCKIITDITLSVQQVQ